MSVTITNLLVSPRQGRKVHVSGQVSNGGSPANNYAVIKISGVHVNALALADPTTGLFSTEVRVDPDLTTTITAQAFSAYGASSTVSGSLPAGPALTVGSFTVSSSMNGDGSFTVTLNFSGTWTVDIAGSHVYSVACMLPTLNRAKLRPTNNDGAESLSSYTFNVPAGPSSLSGTQIELVVSDSWGFPHVVSAVI